ncbi:MAG: CRISPR-associated helicase Cas3' [Oscillospiraceae bacterium]|nr:CRISPR-associated helicase Cas3' [Oscillospiraceae bacterium]
MLGNFKPKVLWAKKPKEDEPDDIVYLETHLEETAGVARKLWKNWIPEGLRKQLDESLLIFLAYAHDLGKASPAFQLKTGYNTCDVDEKIYDGLVRAGFDLGKDYTPSKTPHALVSFGILRRHGFSDAVSVVVGGHHGKPPTRDQVNKDLDAYEESCGFDKVSWIQAQDLLLKKGLEISGIAVESIENITITRPQQVLYSGLVILADWIASSEWDGEMPTMWNPHISENIYSHRFGIENPRPVQSNLIQAAKSSCSPGIYVVEAPMGEGKTEAALAAAEVLASKFGCRGVYFALPSQATSNAMLARVKNWIEHFGGQDGALSIRLAHGKAELNEEYEGIKISGYNSDDKDGDSVVMVHDWLVGRKKGILADFTVGTIDHILMAGLKQKHLALRHLGLANKVLIIDECHAYDVYMESYLLKVVRWLGAYGVPIIILSATLPVDRRNSLIEAYMAKRVGSLNREEYNREKSLAYPLITYTDGQCVKSVPVEEKIADRNKVVEVERLGEDKLIDALQTVLAGGGCVGLIFNTVKKAQEFYEKVAAEFGEEIVELLHAGFIGLDRAKRERKLLVKLGKDSTERPKKRIVIGTQVFEQSLDIDFDVMFTQLCPIDLLLQRMGRLHRHFRESRPGGVLKPKFYVVGADWGDFDNGSKAVYGEYLLMRTCSVLENWSPSVELPTDIPHLVAQVYNDDSEISPPVEFVEDYEKVQSEHKMRNEDRKSRAKGYQISGNITDRNILGWLDNSRKESEGEASIRDGADAIEVLVVQRRGGEICLIPWINEGEPVVDRTPSDRLAKTIAGCSVRLPLAFSRYKKLESTIEILEEQMVDANIKNGWYESYWLEGSLILILDEDLNAVIGEHRLHYCEHLGLRVSDDSKANKSSEC